MTITNEDAQKQTNQFNRAPKVWRDGREVREADLMPHGTLPSSDVSMPQLSEWQLFEGYPQSGLEVRWVDGRKEYRAVARIDDERYEGRREAISDVYKALDTADTEPVSAYSHINPQRVQMEREMAAYAVRVQMKPDEAAPSDMRRYLRELENDLLYPYHVWQREQEQLRQRRAASDQAVTFLLQIDVELLSSEQRSQLAALFAVKGNKK